MAHGIPRGHRLPLALSTAASAALYVWAAWLLPSRHGSWAELLVALLGLAHLATLLVALFRPQHLRAAWRVSSWLSLAVGGLLTGLIALTAREMVHRFGSLGIGVACLLGAIAALVLLATVPFGMWGVRATRRPHGSG